MEENNVPELPKGFTAVSEESAVPALPKGFTDVSVQKKSSVQTASKPVTTGGKAGSFVSQSDEEGSPYALGKDVVPVEKGPVVSKEKEIEKGFFVKKDGLNFFKPPIETFDMSYTPKTVDIYKKPLDQPVIGQEGGTEKIKQADLRLGDVSGENITKEEAKTAKELAGNTAFTVQELNGKMPAGMMADVPQEDVNTAIRNTLLNVGLTSNLLSSRNKESANNLNIFFNTLKLKGYTQNQIDGALKSMQDLYDSPEVINLRGDKYDDEGVKQTGEVKEEYLKGSLTEIHRQIADKIIGSFDKASGLISDLTGMEYGGAFKNLKNAYEEAFVNKQVELPKDVGGEVLRQVIGIAPDMAMTMFLPEMKLSFLSQATNGTVKTFPKFSVIMGGENFLNEYDAQSGKGIPLSEKLVKSSEAGAEGIKEGFVLDMMGYSHKGITQMLKPVAGELKASLIGMGANASMFGASDYVNQLVNLKPGDKINKSQIGASMIVAGLFGVPEITGILYNKAVHNFLSTPDNILKNQYYNGLKLDVKELRQRAEEKSKSTNEEDLLAAQALNNMADNIVISKNVLYNPKPFIDQINEQVQKNQITPEEGKYFVNKINKFVAENDPSLVKIKPLSDEIKRLEDLKSNIEQNTFIDQPLKDAKIKDIEDKKKDIQKQIREELQKPIKAEGGKFPSLPKEPLFPEEAAPTMKLEGDKVIPKTTEDAVQKPSTEKEVPPIGETGQNIPPSGEGVGQAVKGTETAEASKEKVDNNAKAVIDNITVEDHIASNPDLTDFGKENARKNPEEAIAKAKQNAQLAFDYLNGKISPAEYLIEKGFVKNYVEKESAEKLKNNADEESKFWADKINEQAEKTATKAEAPKAGGGGAGFEAVELAASPELIKKAESFGFTKEQVDQMTKEERDEVRTSFDKNDVKDLLAKYTPETTEAGSGVEGDVEFGTAFNMQDATAENTVGREKDLWGKAQVWRERIENAGDILRELSSRGDKPDAMYLMEKVKKLRDWIAKSKKGYTPIDKSIKTIEDFEKTSLRWSDAVDSREYIEKFHSSVLDKIRSEYESIPTYTKEQRLAVELVIDLINNNIKGVESKLSDIENISNQIKNNGKLPIIADIKLGRSSEQPLKEAPKTEARKTESVEALKDVKSTAKALEGESFNYIKNSAKFILDFVGSVADKNLNTNWGDWFLGENKDAKNRIAFDIQSNPKLRNALMSNLYNLWKKEAKSDMLFEDFLNTEITLYRGGEKGFKNEVDVDGFNTWELSKEGAKKFAKGEDIVEKKMPVKNLYGAVDIVGGEIEVLEKTKISDVFAKEIFEQQQWVDLISENLNSDEINQLTDLTKQKKFSEALSLSKRFISEAYHADKAAGKQTELTKAVEDLLGKEAEPSEKIPTAKTEAKFTVEGKDYTPKPETSDVAKKAVKMYYDIKDAEGTTKARKAAKARREFLKENPSFKEIDDNISDIYKQLEQKGLLEKRGDCP